MINWYENLPKEEVPPERLWADAEGLEQWWARIERNREDGTSGGDDDDSDGMQENDLARTLKG